MTDILGLASIVSVYQAGNGIFDLFDKVLLIDEGKELYYGPREQALPFMEELGFSYTSGANVADFLTGVTVPTERKIKSGYENKFPRTADEVRKAYESSSIRTNAEKEYDYPTSEEVAKQTEDFREAVQMEKHRQLPKKSPLTVSFATQIKAAVTRQYQLLWGDKATFVIKQGSTIVQSLIVASLFYNAPQNSSGLFAKSGAIFFSLLFNSLLAMSEVTDSFSARPVLAKHRAFAFYHPAAFCFAQIAADIPLLLFQVTVFALPIYWMVALKATASAFFTYWIMLFAAAM